MMYAHIGYHRIFLKVLGLLEVGVTIVELLLVVLVSFFTSLAWSFTLKLKNILGKGPAIKSDNFLEKFQRRGGGSFPIQKFMLQILGTLNRAFWAWNWYKRVISGFRVCFFNNCIEKNQNKTHFEEGTSESLYYLAIIPPRIYATISVIKNCNIIFLKWGGWGQGPFGNFPKIHPIW